MPRSAFNTTCDVFSGPLDPLPLSLRGTFDCRFVPQLGIFLAGSSSPVRFAWLTIEAVLPRAGWSVPFVSYASGLADQIAVPSGATRAWWVVFSEAVVWRSQQLYYRAHLAPLPLSGAGSTGGTGGIASLLLDSSPDRSRGVTSIPSLQLN